MNIKNLHNEKNEDASVTRKSRRVTVAPSPFNAVKLDLAIIIFLSVLVTITVMNYFEDTLIQLLFLAGFGLVSMFWLIYKTKNVISAYQAKQEDSKHDEET